MNAADLVLAGGHPNATALRTRDSDLTFGELSAYANRFANALAAKGIGKGDRIVFLLDDRPALYAAFFGALRIGAVPLVINTRWNAEQVGFAAEDSGAKLIFSEAAYEATARAASTAVEIVNAKSHDRQSDALSSLTMHPDDMAFWIYTSGTTNSPKAAIHTHRMASIADKTMRDVHGVSADDTVLVTSKTFFAFAIGHALLGALKIGASVVLDPTWPSPDGVAETVAAFRPTVLYSVPTLYRAMLNAGVVDSEAFASVRRCVSAGERLPEQIQARWHDATGTAIAEGIGTSETVFMFLCNPLEDIRPGSAGRVTPGSAVRLESDDGTLIDSRGETGVLWTRLDSVAAGYWNQPELTAASFADGWFRTGDLFRFDADGYWFHEGRADDLLKISGQWINPIEIEDCVTRSGLCEESALIGSPDSDGLERPILYVAQSGHHDIGVLVDSVRATLEAEMPRHKCPRDIRVIDALPRTATGKIQRFRLRELAAES
jgi:benzoate-CoA ligase family protein